MAVEDRLITHSPMENLRSKRLLDPNPITPSSEEFHAIVVDIRA